MTRFIATTAVWMFLLARPLAGQAPPPAAAPTHAQEAYVVEQSRAAWRFENDGTGRRDSFMRVKVQSDAGVEAWGQLAFGYNSANERMDVVFVRVLKADGTVVTADADAVQDLSSAVQREAPVYTDTREKHITVPALRPGDTLELSVATILHTPLAPGQFWTEHEFARAGVVLDEELEIDVPADRPITLRTRPGLDCATTERNGRRVYRWHTARLTDDRDDRDKDAEPKRRKRAAEPEPADVRLTTFTSWDELGRWYRTLEAPQRKPSEEIRKKAAALTAGRATDLEKLKALYEYVAVNFRYVSLSFGVGRYQPHAAVDIFHNQYGDCKDKHTLLASLAESIGLQASTVLIHSQQKLDPDFPSPSQFDHVITRVIVSGEPIWLDATAEVAPFRLLSPPIRKKQALLVDATGAAHVETTPADTFVPNTTKATIDATLNDAGELSARVSLAFSGDFELLMRTLFRRSPAAQWKTLIESMNSRNDLDGEVSDWKVAEPAAIAAPFSIAYTVKNANFAAWKKKEFDLELPLSDWVSIASRDDGDSESTKPIDLGPIRESSYALQLMLPHAFTARPPVPVSIARDYAEYRAEYALDGSTFTARRSLSLRQSELPQGRKGDYSAFRRVVRTDTSQSLGLESRVALAATVASGQKIEELNKNGSDALEGERYTQAVTLLSRVVELEPAHKTAWTNLGRAYLGLHKTDDAIAAFNKQIAINAYDPHAYNNLGYAYQMQQKYDDAEAAFLKQLEIDPLSQFAHENLASVYLERRKYDVALGELQKAVALSPQKAIIHVRLGEAYLNLGDRDRGIAELERGLELGPAPWIWNDVAYQLALNHTNLDHALSLAESAVSTVAAGSRTIAIEHVTTRDLWGTGALGSYWDTLGWIYFAKGDLATAEKFVTASWALVQNAEVGDHLAQIYEKQGRRDDAVQTYALALNTKRPDARTRERLASLVGADRVDAVVKTQAEALARQRSFAVDAKGPADASADFFLLSDRSSSIEGVAFISGDERLRGMGDKLRTLHYTPPFPDAMATKLLRRGTLSCDAHQACSFTLMLPDEAQEAQSR